MSVSGSGKDGCDMLPNSSYKGMTKQLKLQLLLVNNNNNNNIPTWIWESSVHRPYLYLGKGSSLSISPLVDQSLLRRL
ncbi:hypothetical protein RND71_013791 [Anisodus tanguticus]|uniref:Uncharacterized protein n=1 Tax=Anisodus tanguticus TaxID=243964 RepID=A0AAE1SA45_9SOLA|nr:hypothetical protein RND71_013791 [Anisodus tanguticus]